MRNSNTSQTGDRIKYQTLTNSLITTSGPSHQQSSSKKKEPWDPNKFLRDQKVFVGGITSRTSEKKIREVLQIYGEITNIQMATNSNGYCFVTYSNKHEA